MSLFAVQNVSGALLEVPTGFLSDKRGRKWVCRAGAFVMLIAFIIYALADSYLVLFSEAVLNGLSGALVTGNNNALLYDTLARIKRKDDCHQEISKNISLQQLSLALSSLIGAGFIFVSLRAVMVASIIPATIALIVTLGLVEPHWQKNPNENIFSIFGVL